MNDPRLPRLIFALLILTGFIYFPSLYSQLPEMIASHFDGRGTPNGWQSKAVFFSFFVAGSVIVAVLGFGVPSIIAAMPAELINLPNKHYWLAPERRSSTLEFFRASFAWFACAMYLFLILVFDYALQSNLHPNRPPSVSHIWYSILGFSSFLIFWIARIILRFYRVPQSNS